MRHQWSKRNIRNVYLFGKLWYALKRKNKRGEKKQEAKLLRYTFSTAKAVKFSMIPGPVKAEKQFVVLLRVVD